MFGCPESGRQRSQPLFNPFSSFQSTTRIRIVCACPNSLYQRTWRGTIVGKGLHGCVQAMLARMSQRFLRAPLLGILTVCSVCDSESSWENECQLTNYLLEKTSGRLLLGILSEKDIEILLSSAVIVMEGVLMDTITSIDKCGGRRRWSLFRAPTLQTVMSYKIQTADRDISVYRSMISERYSALF
jgi:hypothetical protein